MTQQTEGQQSPPPPPVQPQTEGQRILERKKHVVSTISAKFETELWLERLLIIAGKGGKSLILKSLNSFLDSIMRDEGGKKSQYIADCAMSSISNCFIEAFQMGIEVGGGRDHAYLVRYENICVLEISYKGFIYALGQHFDNPFVVAENVFEGDKFTALMSGEQAAYEYTPNPSDPFPSSWEKLKGTFCYFSYTQRDNKERISRLVRIQKTGPDGLEMIRSKAKGSFAWNDFPFEQTKKSCLRRAAKIPFAQIDFSDGDIDPEVQDNQHYQLESSSADKLKRLMDSRKEDDNATAKDKKPETMGDDGKQNEGAPAGQISTSDQGADPKADDSGASGSSSPEHNGDMVSEGDGDNEKSQTIDGTCQTMPDDSTGSPASSEDATPATTQAWDGKTVYVGNGKSMSKDSFDTAAKAAIYVKKVINQRTHKKTRQDILDGNKLLIIALAKEDRHDLIKELTDLTEKGE